MARRTPHAAFLALAAIAGCSYHSPPSPPAPGRVPDAGAPPAVDAGPPLSPLDHPPPPISGGNALLTARGTLVVADPDRDELAFVDALGATLLGRLALEPHDEPGRMIEDGAGLVHVILRRAGEVLDVDPVARTILGRRAVCGAPRGIAWEASTDRLHVACAEGLLVSLPAGGGEPTRAVSLDDDLRDVVVADGQLYVSRFRAAELLTVDASGAIVQRRRAASRWAGDLMLEPDVAWRLRAMPGGGVIMLHQLAATSSVDVRVTGYGTSSDAPCATSIVQPVFSVFRGSGPPVTSGAIELASLLVDLAPSPDGSTVYLASAASMRAESGSSFVRGSIYRVPVSSFSDDCATWTELGPDEPSTAVEVLPDGRAIGVDRAPARVFIAGVSGRDQLVDLGVDDDATYRGHDLLHAATPELVSCASCHPEAGDDGHVWQFAPIGPRRTQALTGGLLATAPFHWSGDQPDMQHIMSSTFSERMGHRFSRADVTAIADWLNAQPAPSARVPDPNAAARGRALFESVEVGCAECHAGATLTNDRNADIGRGSFQVPSLRGVAFRAPYLHDGCAATLEDVVAGVCTPIDQHGHTSQLDDAERADLLAYLRSL